MFSSAVDIANRALQHCGLPRIATPDFSENGQRAQECGFAYGKLKRAELRDNVWVTSTRKAVLRPIDTNTMLLAPTLWEESATYFQGSIVSDSINFLWISRTQNNTGAPPEISYTWEPYFGPMTASLYDSSQVYFAGEIVYTAPGDGTYNVYLSTISDNAVDPSLPNQWSATAVYQANQVVQAFAAWAGGTTYAAGATVTYTDGFTYTSLVNGNVGNVPPATGASWILTPLLTLQSQLVPITTVAGVPQSSPVIEWSPLTTYSIGSFVMFNAVEYVSTANSNTANQPNTSGSWAALTGGTLWMSLFNLNINNAPASTPANWASGTTYAIGNTVAASDGIIYTSLVNSNSGHDPSNGGSPAQWQSGSLVPWTTAFTLGGGNPQWLQIGGSAFPAGVGLTTLDIRYPLGAGPYSQDTTRNVYRKPANFLRVCSQDPKAGAVSWLGVPGNDTDNDWTYEGNYFTTWDGSPIPYRFVADIADVTQFDDMFCEALAARIGIAVCPILTQSTEKVKQIEAEYEKWSGLAKTVNGIEIGWVNPPQDDLIACRY